ncbi:unnamed protein product [Paramecium primaurelia]|uniref:Uncharacterized protein n=1 Tax=Paramecium primaurelia TaxID=5886 RepID=A0A8S1QG29_PARPR|nr:unnamed protein product [Paramecium primaurelia]
MQAHFQKMEALADIFDQVKDVDIQIFGAILEIFRKEQVQDSIGYLSEMGNQRQLVSQILKQAGNFTQNDTEQILSVVRNDIKQFTEVLRKLKDHDFNKIDYSSKEKEESKFILINSVIINRSQNLYGTLIQCGSNSLNLLIQMKVDLSNKNFENINIQNASLVGANFVKCKFSGSIFNNVNISGINLNGALLFNCKWKDLRISELNKLHGHSSWVRSVCFSPDGNTLASGSADQSIRFLDVKKGQQKAKLDGHSDNVQSVCFSPNGNILASGYDNGSVLLWDTKTRKKRGDFSNFILFSMFSQKMSFYLLQTHIKSCSPDGNHINRSSKSFR